MRKQARRSFTVEIKHSTTSGRSFIPTKSPQGRESGKHLASPSPSWASVFEEKAASASVTGEAAEPRRILPSLIAWEPSAPKREFDRQPEPPMPRVRRAVALQEAAEAPRRRGRPPKLKLEPEPVAETAILIPSGPMLPVPERPVSSQVAPVALVRHPRSARIEGAGLPRAERWKRRLPRACW